MDSNDQILSINDIYLTESSSNINKALFNLFDTNQRYYTHNQHQQQQQQDQDTNITTSNNNNNSIRKLDLLISRDINTKLIKKHSKKPSLYFNTTNFKAFVTKSISNTSLSSNSSSITTISTTTASSILNTNSLLSGVVNLNNNNNNTTVEEHSLYKNPIKLSSSSSSLLLNNFKCNTEEIINKKLHHQLLRKNKQKFSSYLIYDLNNDSLRYIIKSSINNYSSNNTSTIRDSTTSKQTKFNSINNKNQMTLKDMMVLNTEWTQLETIELLNESSSSSSTSSSLAISKTGPGGAKTSTLAPPGSTSGGGVGAHGSGGGGFGFGITGNKSTGVVVKAITPGGSAQRVFYLYIYLFFFRFLFVFFVVDFYFTI